MKQTGVARCPACLSALESGPACAHCGWSASEPVARRRAGPWLAALALAVLGAGAAVLWKRDAGAPPAALAPQDEPRAEAAAPSGAEPPRPAAAATHTIDLDAAGTSVRALLVRPAHAAQAAALLPLQWFPRRGELRAAAGEVVGVVGVAEAYGFLLLEVAGAGHGPPLPVRTAPVLPGEALRALPAGASVRVLARSAAEQGILRLDASLEAGLALADAEGHAAAFSLGGDAALAVGPATSWLEVGRRPRPVDEVQRELRRLDPMSRLQDAAAAAQAAATVEETRVAIEELELGFGAARDPDLVGAYDRALRGAHRLLAQRLVRDGRAAEGAAHLRRCLDRFVGDVDCLADAIAAAAAAGELFAAADLWLELRSRERERAAALAGKLADALFSAGRAALRADATTAVDLLLRGVELFPDRARLRMAYADSLLAAGQPLAALDQAWIAAGQDATLAASFEAIARRAGNRAEGSVEVPFDPETHAIQARCEVAGVELELVVDTGASLTVVPTAVAARGAPTGRRVRIDTVSGTVEGNLVRLHEIRIGSLTVRNVQAVGLDLPGSLAGKGLLGMNVLRRLDVRIDAQRGLLVLRRAETR